MYTILSIDCSVGHCSLFVIPVLSLRAMPDEFVEASCWMMHARVLGLDKVAKETSVPLEEDGIWPVSASERFMSLTTSGTLSMKILVSSNQWVWFFVFICSFKNFLCRMSLCPIGNIFSVGILLYKEIHLVSSACSVFSTTS